MLSKAMQVLPMLKFSILLTLNYNLKDTESTIKNKLKRLFSELRRFKFLTTLVLVFKKIESKDKTKCDNMLTNLFYNYIKHTKTIGKGSGWIIDSVIDHTISTSKYDPLAGSGYIKLPKD